MNYPQGITMEYLLCLLLSFSYILLQYHACSADETPQFLPNSLEIEVQVLPNTAKSIHYVAQCDKVWLEFILTACDYEATWKATVGFYSMKDHQQQQDSNSNSEIQESYVQAYQQPVATLIDQFHRKIIRISPENTREGAYKVILSGFTRATTVRIFTSESDQSNYRDVFYPTSNSSSELWSSLQQANKLKNMWLSWPSMASSYENLGEHLTCLTVVTYSAFERCESCAYSSMQDSVKYGQCVKPLFRKCATNYHYEPYLPTELRYETEKMVGLISKLHPITGFITPYFKQVITEWDYQEVANPFMLTYLTLRPKEEVRMGIEEVSRMQWSKIYLLVQPCHYPVRMKVDNAKSIVKSDMQVFTVDERSTVKVRNGHKTVTALRYFFTDDLTDRNPMSFTADTQVNVDTSKSTCDSIALVIVNSQPDNHYCAIATEIKKDKQITDYETPPCMNPRQDLKDADSQKWESCQITLPRNYYSSADSLKLTEIVLNGIPSGTELAIEVFAKPLNNFYPITIWSKVGSIFHGRTLTC